MKTIKILAVAVLVSTIISCNNKGYTNKALKTEIDSVSYAIGLDMAAKFKVNFNEVEISRFVQGLNNGLDSTNMLMKQQEVEVVLRNFFRKKKQAVALKRQEEFAKKAAVDFAAVKEEGEAFLTANKAKKGVQVTASGLQYIVLKKGTGKKPSASSRVKVHYHGTLIDGTVFDSSVEKNRPYETNVNAVIAGWIEGLQLMQVGAKYRFFVPQELAYGATPRSGGKIKPFMPLIFEVELLKIN